MPQKRVVTNAILEAFRTNCWAALCHVYSVETVEKCVEEALTGNTLLGNRVNVPPEALGVGLAHQHKVTERQILELRLAEPGCEGLDDGELHLLAWIKANKVLPSSSGIVLITTADKAAVLAAGILGWIDYVVSLEHLLQPIGATQQAVRQLAPHFRESWLSSVRTQFHLKMR